MSLWHITCQKIVWWQIMCSEDNTTEEDLVENVAWHWITGHTIYQGDGE